MDSKITYKLHRCTHNKRTCLTFWVDKPLGFLPQLSNIGVILGKVIIMIKKVDIGTIYNCRGLQHIHIDTHNNTITSKTELINNQHTTSCLRSEIVAVSIVKNHACYVLCACID